MPPRLSLLSSTSLNFTLPLRPSTRLPSPVQPTNQARSASILSSLSDNPKAYNKRIRRGRGPASGKGKTSGRGHKGQKQHGKVPFRQNLGRHFGGGQTPEEIVHGKHGFDNHFSTTLTPLNLDTLTTFHHTGRLPPSTPSNPLTLRELLQSRCIHGIKDGIKLLARNRTSTPLTFPIHITVSRASAASIAAIEAAGGSVTTRYYTKASINRILKGETHPTLSLLSLGGIQGQVAASSLTTPHTTTTSTTSTDTEAQAAALLSEMRRYKYRLPDPTGRKDLEYYRDVAHRGYLSWQVREGQGPSLFFKTPEEIATGIADGGRRRENRGKAAGKGESALW